MTYCNISLIIKLNNMKHSIKHLGFGAIAVALGVAGFAAQQNAPATVDTDDTTMANIEAISQTIIIEYDTKCTGVGEGCTTNPYHWEPIKWGDQTND